MSLDRLIQLAKRTGDRLIVHDRLGEDVVIMSVEEYEDLLDEVIEGGFEHVPSDGGDSWHRAEDVIEDRYHETVPHRHQEHAQHDRQYEEGDWEEARHPHERIEDDIAAQASYSPEKPHVLTPQPIEYQTQEGVEVEGHREENLDEPVFYEEPV